MYTFKHSRLLPGALGAILGLSLLASGAAAQAASLTTAQVSAITSLLQAFGVNQSTILNVQAVLEDATTTVSVTPPLPGSMGSSTCVVLTRGLHLGLSDQETDGDVSRLQAFLAQHPNFYPAGLVTGYFGSSTLQAVERWQAAAGIVASGTPQTTGFGLIGPRTLAQMNREMRADCEGDSAEHRQDAPMIPVKSMRVNPTKSMPMIPAGMHPEDDSASSSPQGSGIWN